MSHPSVCPKCKYNRPIFLSYCPHCKEEERNKKDPNWAMLSKMFEKMWVKVVTAEVLSPKEKRNARKEITGKYHTNLKDTKQEKQQATSVKKTDKLKTVQRARNNTNRKAKSRAKSSKTKRKIKNRV